VLDVALQGLSFRYGDAFALRDVSITFPLSRHTAISGAPGCGATTLLRLIAGTLKPESGDVIIGQRRVNGVKASHRPLVHVTAELEVPARWSVQHALVAAVRGRSLDRIDRHREYMHAAERWQLQAILERKIATLSSTEQLRVRLARIELLRPAIVIADRILERASPSARLVIADELYRLFRILGTTVISAPSSREELAFADSIVVLDGGRVVQNGPPAEIYREPAVDAAAVATGEVDVVPIVIRGTTVESIIGEWTIDPAPFQGEGVALVRPGDFAPAARGEESDLIFGIEEAGFVEGRWLARGFLSGGMTLRVELPRETTVHKGRVLALRYDPARFTLLPRAAASSRATGVPTDVVPSIADSR
jgi:spermidine/putrescine transport system ATP-binding protein